MWFITLEGPLSEKGASFLVENSGNEEYSSWKCNLSLLDLSSFYVEIKKVASIKKIPLGGWPNLPTDKSISNFLKINQTLGEKQRKQMDEFFLGISRQLPLIESIPVQSFFSEEAERNRVSRNQRMETERMLKVPGSSPQGEKLMGRDSFGNEVDLFILPRIPPPSAVLPFFYELEGERVVIKLIMDHICSTITRFLDIHHLIHNPSFADNETQLLFHLQSVKEEVERETEIIKEEKNVLTKIVNDLKSTSSDLPLQKFFDSMIIEIERSIRWADNVEPMVLMKIQNHHSTQQKFNVEETLLLLERRANDLVLKTLEGNDPNVSQDMTLLYEESNRLMNKCNNESSKDNQNLIERLKQLQDFLNGHMKKTPDTLQSMSEMEERMFKCIEKANQLEDLSPEESESEAKKILREIEELQKQLGQHKVLSPLDEGVDEYVRNRREDLQENLANLKHSFCQRHGLGNKKWKEQRMKDSGHLHEKYQESMFEL
eukprot:TRINITY_DN11463_c0_g1_i1.p1 TRINITY_DN11463_c0_g1~~TRINITY_DN11463_c0_g1_i1.p1  ORF type:complete len:488 (-),score=182.09 TRINITY_DN11463_c0_g1_i1:217-1680(-)